MQLSVAGQKCEVEVSMHEIVLHEDLPSHCDPRQCLLQKHLHVSGCARPQCKQALFTHSVKNMISIFDLNPEHFGIKGITAL